VTVEKTPKAMPPDELAVIRDVYRDTYPVRPLINHIDAVSDDTARLEYVMKYPARRWAYNSREAIDEMMRNYP